jgi:hypothetical protein
MTLLFAAFRIKIKQLSVIEPEEEILSEDASNS